jgi:hypothetical protein
MTCMLLETLGTMTQHERFAGTIAVPADSVF